MEGLIICIIIGCIILKFADGFRFKKCPHCKESIKNDAKVCKHCGRDV